METKYCVYCHTSPSGKRYIGITSRKPKERWRGGNGYKDNPAFFNAIKKYGWESFEHEVLFTGLTREEASETERRLISKYDTTNKANGYNIELGGYGGGHPTSDETKKKISDANRGRSCPEWQKQHLSRINKGVIPVNLDAIHRKNEKMVDQFDLDGNFIATHQSIRKAARALNINENSVACCCRGINSTAGGFVWRFHPVGRTT